MTSQKAMQQDTHVHVLMGVFNGASFLPAQLRSIADQTRANVSLTCSDDASDDHSTSVISQFASKTGLKINQRIGPASGFSRNYMGLISALPEQPGYVALADQDDIWNPDKLSRAITALSDLGDAPALYCARRWIWDPEGGRCAASARHYRSFSFKNALIENVAPGNTIVLNPAAAELARRAADKTGPVFAHDWWLYLLIVGVGGHVHFDNGAPCIWYRQHAGNAIGAGHGLRQQVRRKLGVVQGVFADRISNNVGAMNAVTGLLTPQARETLHRFEAARNSPFFNRLSELLQIAPRRQSTLGTLGFWGAASFGRI